MSWCRVMNVIFDAEHMAGTDAMLTKINEQLKDYKIEFINTGGFVSSGEHDMEILHIKKEKTQS